MGALPHCSVAPALQVMSLAGTLLLVFLNFRLKLDCHAKVSVSMDCSVLNGCTTQPIINVRTGWSCRCCA
jgi:hypothetical protein